MLCRVGRKPLFGLTTGSIVIDHLAEMTEAPEAPLLHEIDFSFVHENSTEGEHPSRAPEGQRTRPHTHCRPSELVTATDGLCAPPAVPTDRAASAVQPSRGSASGTQGCGRDFGLRVAFARANRTLK